MASSSSFLLLAALLASVSWQATASDPSPLQDFLCRRHEFTSPCQWVCLQEPRWRSMRTTSSRRPNLDKPRVPNKVGSNVTLINVMQIAGLNTLGISIARIDYAPLGQNPPHTHPRATEILTVLEGTLYGWLCHIQPARPPNKNQVPPPRGSTKGKVVCLPRGAHPLPIQPQPPTSPLLQLPALSSQNPGAITIANAVFGSDPAISDDVLAKAFQGGKEYNRLSPGSVLGETTTTKSDLLLITPEDQCTSEGHG
uniref:Germin-like protein n=1 Tax=Triticum aestivum TaxID=4565 RepID=B9VR55_WHEAT|nr:germin-like protein 5 [Triticum aestivum]